MIINNKILCIPPYISTNWRNIVSLRKNDNFLLVQLATGDLIEIPALDDLTIQQIFLMHANAPDEIDNLAKMPSMIENSLNLPFRLGIGMGSIQDIGSSIFQHEPSLTNAPKIPIEIIEKIISITKIVTPEGLQVISRGEEGCNCVHCQIADYLNKNDSSNDIQEYAESALTIENGETAQWDIKQTGHNIFCVANRSEPYEQYNVCLGETIGCTCGNTGCDHIIAVLRT